MCIIKIIEAPPSLSPSMMGPRKTDRVSNPPPSRRLHFYCKHAASLCRAFVLKIMAPPSFSPHFHPHAETFISHGLCWR